MRPCHRQHRANSKLELPRECTTNQMKSDAFAPENACSPVMENMFPRRTSAMPPSRSWSDDWKPNHFVTGMKKKWWAKTTSWN
jgi:hypothetical protein